MHGATMKMCIYYLLHIILLKYTFGWNIYRLAIFQVKKF